MITNEKKKMRQKTPKIVGKCQILPLLIFLIKTSNSNPHMI